MINIIVSLVLSTALLTASVRAAASSEPHNRNAGTVEGVSKEESSPNILVILIDDLGYTDLGYFGGEAETPNIDALAQESVVFSNAHAYPSCGPTRATLITGQDPHRVGFGSQNGFAPPGVSLSTTGYGGSLEGEYTGIAELLGKAGYKAYQSGKWHLGHSSQNSPISLGFDKNYTLLDGAASHYADMTSVALRVSGDGRAQYEADGKKIDTLPEDFYSTKTFTDELVKMLSSHDSDEGPFFAYLAYTAVHDPLHAPEALVQKYLNIYTGDAEELRRTRQQKLFDQGLGVSTKRPTRWLPDLAETADLTEYQKQDLKYRMAVYSAMIEYLDIETGKLLEFLKSAGQYKNTLIIFLSDNGAALQPRTVYALGPEDRRWQSEHYPKNKMKDYGKPGSYPTLSVQNAQAISGPWLAGKASVHEGGTRVPMFVKLPGNAAPRISGTLIHVSDIYPTLADYAGATIAEGAKLMGTSAKPYLERKAEGIGDDELGLEFFGARAYRDGDWKLVFAERPYGGTGDWALYNLKKDPGETEDVSSENPELLVELVVKWHRYAEENGVVVSPMNLVNEIAEVTKSIRLSTDWATD